MTTTWAAAVAALVVAAPLAREARGDFALWNDAQLTVNTYHSYGIVYDESQAHLVSGGSVGSLYAHDRGSVDISGGPLWNVYGLYARNSSSVRVMSAGRVQLLCAYHSSTVEISGGLVSDLYARDSSSVQVMSGCSEFLYAYNSSTVDISGGAVLYFYGYDSSSICMSRGEAYSIETYDSSAAHISGGHNDLGLIANNSSTVDISGGYVSCLTARHSSAVDISGGTIDYLWALGTSVVTFDAQDFRLGPGLWVDGDRVLGTGILSGEWFDGTPWAVNIFTNDPGATILAIPEPATLCLLAVGGLAVIRRRMQSRRGNQLRRCTMNKALTILAVVGLLASVGSAYELKWKCAKENTNDSSNNAYNNAYGLNSGGQAPFANDRQYTWYGEWSQSDLAEMRAILEAAPWFEWLDYPLELRVATGEGWGIRGGIRFRPNISAFFAQDDWVVDEATNSQASNALGTWNKVDGTPVTFWGLDDLDNTAEVIGRWHTGSTPSAIQWNWAFLDREVVYALLYDPNCRGIRAWDTEGFNDMALMGSKWTGEGTAYLIFMPEPGALSLLALGGAALLRRCRGFKG
jgi:hypothetical protein